MRDHIEDMYLCGLTRFRSLRSRSLLHALCWRDFVGLAPSDISCPPGGTVLKGCSYRAFGPPAVLSCAARQASLPDGTNQNSPALCAELQSLRRGRDSNSWYGYPYGSLANCWFQPLTHLSGRDCRNRFPDWTAKIQQFLQIAIFCRCFEKQFLIPCSPVQLLRWIPAWTAPRRAAFSLGIPKRYPGGKRRSVWTGKSASHVFQMTQVPC